MTADAPAFDGDFLIDYADSGLKRLTITTAEARAEVYLQGAHLTSWQPAGHDEVLFLSARSSFAPGKAIRGGVPIIFPWFGPRTANACFQRTDGPAHGFARTSEWLLHSTEKKSDNLICTFTLTASDLSKELGYDQFLVTYRVSIGAQLKLELAVENRGAQPLCFEEALHSYFAVEDVQLTKISGLEDTEYLDKTDNFKKKKQGDQVLIMTGETDRPYINTGKKITIDDQTARRRIIIAKQNSDTTVVWNQWATLTAKMSDMEPDGWRRMVCIESANAGESLISLAPGQRHEMRTEIRVQKY